MSRHHPSVLGQRGAFSILAAGTLLLLLMFMALVLDSGRLYLQQRTLQKVADTAALGSLLQLPDGNCSSDPALTAELARSNAAANGFNTVGERGLSVRCADIIESGGLRVAVPNNTGGRAVEVTATHRVPSSLVLQVGSAFSANIADSVDLRAVAVAARDEPVAAFTVGSQLLRLNNSRLLGTLLSAIGLEPQTLTLLDSVGLANATITPAGLLAALGVDVGIEQLKALSPEGLLDLVDTQVGALGIDRLIDASIALIDDAALAADLEALRLRLLPEAPLLREIDLKLLGTAQSPGLLSLATAGNDPVGAALDARIQLGDILTTSLLVGVQGRGLAIGAPDASGALGGALDLLNTVRLEAGVVEPPSIGIGPVGTTAYNAQVRLKLDVDTSRGVLGGLLGLLGTSVQLPIIIDLVDAAGELTALSCDGPEPSATIEVISALGSACIGNMPADTLWSTRGSCTHSVQDQSLIKLLNLNLLHGSVALPVLPTRPQELTFRQQDLPQTQSSDTNPLHAGTLVADLTGELLQLLGNAPSVPDRLNAAQATSIADRYLALITPAYPGYYTYGEIDQIKDRLHRDGVDWERPAFLFSQNMTAEWASSVRLGGCLVTGSANPLRYGAACARGKLIDSLQSEARSGFLGSLLGGLLGKVVQPLLATILDPLIDLLEGLLNVIGEYILSPLLDDLLGLELSRTDVTVHSISCGAPRLVR